MEDAQFLKTSFLKTAALTGQRTFCTGFQRIVASGICVDVAGVCVFMVRFWIVGADCLVT
jgi:hypothetical protein